MLPLPFINTLLTDTNTNINCDNIEAIQIDIFTLNIYVETKKCLPWELVTPPLETSGTDLCMTIITWHKIYLKAIERERVCVLHCFDSWKL